MKYKFKINDSVTLPAESREMTVTGYILKDFYSVIDYIKRRGSSIPPVAEKKIISVVCSWLEEDEQKWGEFNEDALALTKDMNSHLYSRNSSWTIFRQQLDPKNNIPAYTEKSRQKINMPNVLT